MNADSPPHAVRATHVYRRYGAGGTAVTALDDVSMSVRAGEFVAVTGPSGSGKSTLLHCLAGLDRVDAGAVRVAGTDLTTLSERELTRLRRDRIGVVFQSYHLLSTLTAGENLLLPLLIAGRPPDRAWVRRLVDAVGLRDRLDHRPAELSGGQQQRLAVARALVGRPALVLADEPTGNLDSAAGRSVLTLLRRAVDELGQTVVMVTHDANAAAVADRVVCLADGRVVPPQGAPA
jgi:putative ABC transport system ATP-binding protein